jgi:Family of unknown function (DUF6256)
MVPARIWAPLVTAFILFLGIAANSARRRTEPTPRAWSPAAYVRTLTRTVVGGYLVFLSIVVVFHVGLAGDRAAFEDAAAKGAMLAFVVVTPAFAALSWLEHALRR